MLQLDQFVFFGVYSSFVIYLVGIFYFCSYLVPTITYLVKLTSARVLYYGLGIIELRSFRIAEIVMYALRYHRIQYIVVASLHHMTLDDIIHITIDNSNG